MREGLIHTVKGLLHSEDQRTRRIKYNIFSSLLFKGGGIIVSLWIVLRLLIFLRRQKERLCMMLKPRVIRFSIVRV